MFTNLTLEQLVAELARSQDPLLIYTRQQIKQEILARRALAVSNRSVKERVIEAFSGRCEFAPNGCDCENHCERRIGALTNGERGGEA